jgi:NADH-quinone oxidoreductase subunit L
MLFKGWLDEAITVTSSHVSMVELKQQFHGALGMIFHTKYPKKKFKSAPSLT